MRNETRIKGSAAWQWLVILTVVGLGAWYLASKPFAARVNEAARQGTQWTPEQINKNPSGYFNWAVSELTKNVEKLKANELSLKIEKKRVERAMAENAGKVKSSTKMLDAARAAYKALPDAEGSGKKFPLSVEGVTFDTLSSFKRDCYKLENRRKVAEASQLRFSAAVAKIDGWLDKIAAKQTEAEINLETANAQLAILRTQQTIDGVGGLAESINGLLDEIEMVASDSDPARVGSLLDVAERSETPSGGLSDADFDKLMGL